MAIKPYLQLVRLPNVFTAAADSLAGWLLVQGSLAIRGAGCRSCSRRPARTPGGSCSTTCSTSRSTGWSGPNGRCRRARSGGGSRRPSGSSCSRLGLPLAVAFGDAHGWRGRAALIACVLAYDAGLKRTLLGPEVMGACRGLEPLARHEPGARARGAGGVAGRRVLRACSWPGSPGSAGPRSTPGSGQGHRGRGSGCKRRAFSG